MTAHRLSALLLVLGLVIGSSCSGSTQSGYPLTVTFERAVGLYEGSDVRVMGVDAGTVTQIEIVDEGILVHLLMDSVVPLRSDVMATIVPQSVIGERNIVLGPVWRSGDARLEAGSHIPVERTALPVEPDEALAALTDLAGAIDPDKLQRLVSNAADAFEGSGGDINRALASSGDLLELLAGQDETIAAIGRHLAGATQELASREADLGRLLSGFAEVTETLADHRGDIRSFLEDMNRLMGVGSSLLDAHTETLPDDLAILAAWAMTVDANADSASEFVSSLDQIFGLLLNAYNPKYEVLNVTLNGTRSFEGAIDALLGVLEGLPAACRQASPPPWCAEVFG